MRGAKKKNLGSGWSSGSIENIINKFFIIKRKKAHLSLEAECWCYHSYCCEVKKNEKNSENGKNVNK